MTAVRFDGGPAFRAACRRAGRELTDGLKAANARVGAIVAAAGRVKAPRRTGRLAASIRPAKAANRAQVRAGGAAVRYAKPVHWGVPARGIEARPFLTDAAQTTQTQWLAAYRSDLDRIIGTLEGTY